MSWAVGFFSFGTNSEGNASSSTLSVTGRITALPQWQDEARRLVHVGLAFSSRKEITRGAFHSKSLAAAPLRWSGKISNVDLKDKELDGGRVLDFSAGLNWYANATQKVMLNYIRSKVEGVGNANILLLRYQYRPLPR